MEALIGSEGYVRVLVAYPAAQRLSVDAGGANLLCHSFSLLQR
jgi:hypothetical protein